MFKTVKGKVVAGVVTVGLLSSVGAAFASLDAGAQLKSWYDKQFNTTSAVVKGAAAAYGLSKVPALTKEYNGIKEGNGTAVNEAKVLKTGEANTSIQTASQTRIDSVNKQKADIKANMDAQFAQLFTEAQNAINQAGDQAYAWAQSDLGKYTSDKGAQALADMDTELTATKKKAVDDLSKAINKAKIELSIQLGTKAWATTGKINNAIDAKIAELRQKINDTATELLAAQKQLIADKADSYVKQAEDELETVVGNI